jgi:hypothetical protein
MRHAQQPVLGILRHLVLKVFYTVSLETLEHELHESFSDGFHWKGAPVILKRLPTHHMRFASKLFHLFIHLVQIVVFNNSELSGRQITRIGTNVKMPIHTALDKKLKD